VRSSVIGETIWDRGTYESHVVDLSAEDFEAALVEAVRKVLASAPGKQVGIVIQRYIEPLARGEFGNLLRVSKTRDHWELCTSDAKGDYTSRVRLNAQRDEAANQGTPIELKNPRERLFGSLGAWLNNQLLRGGSQRVNCEWIADQHRVYLVQIDGEDEDFAGVNPFQLRVTPVHQPAAARGTYLVPAEGEAIQRWDKLRVLDELWEPDAPHKPTLFFVPLDSLPIPGDEIGLEQLEADFRGLIGPDNIVVRTSALAGEKPTNLPRTDGMNPATAAAWCLNTRDEFLCGKDAQSGSGIAFVAHRFMAARASAWARAEPDNPIVEIHSLWGLPDALQYCPYDIWEVHLPTNVATEYPDYKSNILIPREDGEWAYVRVKNEVGRSLSIGRREAIEIAERTAAIASRLGKPCHVMWFVGCVTEHKTAFNVPWYWTEAHEAEKNTDRTNYRVFLIRNPSDLQTFKETKGPRTRHAIELRPEDQTLIRDRDFVSLVGKTAKEHSVPIILAGSTLGHAYYELRRIGCTVVTRGEKEYSRIRRSATFGKLVRDNIPRRIAQRGETDVTRKIPNELKKCFLISKLLEEALEVRYASNLAERKIELADLYEVVRALAQTDGLQMEEVIKSADEKRLKAGGFDEGLVLLQTGILGRSHANMQDADKQLAQVLARKLPDGSYELPFTFFGFMEIDQPRTLFFEDFGVRITLTLKNDRLHIRASRNAEQLDLPLDETVL